MWQLKSCVFHIPVLTISSGVIYLFTLIFHPNLLKNLQISTQYTPPINQVSLDILVLKSIVNQHYYLYCLLPHTFKNISLTRTPNTAFLPSRPLQRWYLFPRRWREVSWIRWQWSEGLRQLLGTQFVGTKQQHFVHPEIHRQIVGLLCISRQKGQVVTNNYSF